MKPISDYFTEADRIIADQKAARQRELEAKILRSADCGTSKRDLLGLTRRKKQGNTPMFDEGKLF